MQIPSEGGLSECSLCHISVRKEDLEQHYLICKGPRSKEQSKCRKGSYSIDWLHLGYSGVGMLKWLIGNPNMSITLAIGYETSAASCVL